MYNQGDIVVLRFPFTDGTEFKKRPALIVSKEIVNKTGDYIVVQITSKQNKDEFSVAIEENSCKPPLPLTSYIRTHKIFTIHKSLIIYKYTEANPFLLKKVVAKIIENIKCTQRIIDFE